ncbi:uncharacterized protein LOC125944037 [Dermacentor silvarum]|uniref:uncharacterized protein LOC125944037 n=1 Tax=Dermacentor silvarum TaxID=543639 RepID=UPI002101377B|nr:uncharacterized protein LOC125944037 [Dermacentor silvarum]
MSSSEPPGVLAPACINGTMKVICTAALDSGHGSDAMMRSSNPFMLLVQVLLGRLLAPAELSPNDNVPSSSPLFLVNDPETLMPLIVHQPNTTPGGATMSSLEPPGVLAAACINGTMKVICTAALDSGHGSDAMMRSSNPFMLLVQVPYQTA